jgi:hypothetical protein
MDKPLDHATPLKEVYQHLLKVLVRHGRKDSTCHKYLVDLRRFEAGCARQTDR